MEAILYIELLGLLYKSTYDFNMNTYICNDCLSLFNIALIIIEKKKKCEEYKLHNVRTISYYEKARTPHWQKRLNDTIDLTYSTEYKREKK
jgi:hypothetical protein